MPGYIKPEVENSHFRRHPEEREIARPLLECFEVSWAQRRSSFNSEFSVYILRPDAETKRLFGFEMEVLAFIFDYERIEARTISAINHVFSDESIRTRVEKTSFFLITPDQKAKEWIAHYQTKNPQSRTAIVTTINDIKTIRSKYELRSHLSDYLYMRDLFDYRLPIDNDKFFFGRDSLVAKLRDQIKKNQNSGLFGLRKTGKTSIIYKLIRDSEVADFASIIYFDCKHPSIRKKSSSDLLAYIIEKICDTIKIKRTSIAKGDPFDAFSEAIRICSKKRPICLVFDEIEYISPTSPTDSHWKNDFIDFWQTIWSTQSNSGNLSFIIGGVNPEVCESGAFDGIQNPIFSIVDVEYVQGLDRTALSSMMKTFGSQMGLDFSDDAIDFAYDQYGGHPLLTRLASSYLHKKHEKLKSKRPITIDKYRLSIILDEVNSQLFPYCAHVVHDVAKFYTDEYEILLMAATGLHSDFLELGRDAEMTRHLRNYGVISIDTHGTPKINWPILSHYLSREFCRENKQRIPKRLIPLIQREEWVEQSIARLISETRKLVQSTKDVKDSPFNSKGIPDSDILLRSSYANNESQFKEFISSLYMCLYEGIYRNVKTDSDREEFSQKWEFLQKVLLKIKCYRDFTHHLDLSERTKGKFEAFCASDIGATLPNSEQDGWFGLQQAVIDDLLVAIQKEAAVRGL